MFMDLEEELLIGKIGSKKQSDCEIAVKMLSKSLSAECCKNIYLLKIHVIMSYCFTVGVAMGVLKECLDAHHLLTNYQVVTAFKYIRIVQVWENWLAYLAIHHLQCLCLRWGLL